MNGLNKKEITYLQHNFNNRVTFDQTECILYSHDIAAIPKLIKPLIGITTPEGVVQPESEDELINLIQFADKIILS
jgi:hypothetical protein